VILAVISSLAPLRNRPRDAAKESAAIGRVARRVACGPAGPDPAHSGRRRQSGQCRGATGRAVDPAARWVNGGHRLTDRDACPLTGRAYGSSSRTASLASRHTDPGTAVQLHPSRERAQRSARIGSRTRHRCG